MGEPAEVSNGTRNATRQLAARVVDAVLNDEPSPFTCATDPMIELTRLIKVTTNNKPVCAIHISTVTDLRNEIALLRSTIFDLASEVVALSPTIKTEKDGVYTIPISKEMTSKLGDGTAQTFVPKEAVAAAEQPSQPKMKFNQKRDR